MLTLAAAIGAPIVVWMVMATVHRDEKKDIARQAYFRGYQDAVCFREQQSDPTANHQPQGEQ